MTWSSLVAPPYTPERVWLVGAYRKTSVGDHQPATGVLMVRRIGDTWFDWIGRPVDPPEAWTDQPEWRTEK